MMSDLSSTESGLLTLRNLNISPTTSSFSAQNSPDEFVHSPLEDAEHAIRLLDLEPSSDATLDIRCNVRHVILDTDDNTLQYKTLSYTWGDPNDTKAIFVDGKQYRVTLNCHAALRRLRELGERSLWMDAICINQTDKEEKSKQVGFMRNIYQNAEDVLVWLDAWDNDKTKEAMAISLIQDILDGKTFKERSRAGRANRQLSYDRVQKMVNNESLLEKWCALAELYSHAWFDRLWVEQEYTVALKSTAVLKHHTTSMFDVADAASTVKVFSLMGGQITNSKNEEPVKRTFHLSTKIMFRQMKRLSYDRQTQETELSTVDVLESCRRLLCFDPRDRIFAPIGPHRNFMRPDYNKSTAEVYTQLTRYLVEHQKDLEVLNSAGVNGGVKGILPSWVADWRKIDVEIPINSDQYRACGKYKCRIQAHNLPTTLSIVGVKVDTVIKTLEISQKSVHEAFSLWKEHFDRYPDGSDPRETWHRTVVFDTTFDGGVEVRLSSEQVKLYAKMSEFDCSSNEEFEKAFPRTGSNVKAYWQWADKVRQSYKSSLSWDIEGNIMFFISKLGYMGVSHCGVREGDAISVLMGGQIPFILRPEDEHYLLVEGAFVWGIMDGEIFENKSSKEVKDMVETFNIQ